MLTRSRFASAVVLKIGFGVTVASDDDPYIKIAVNANLATAQGGNPGTALVDYFPTCECVEVWRKHEPIHAPDLC